MGRRKIGHTEKICTQILRDRTNLGIQLHGLIILPLLNINGCGQTDALASWQGYATSYHDSNLHMLTLRLAS
jgi:hypothetical protein